LMAANDVEPFFHRRATHRLISDLSVPEDWTIYLGSGATIDRTGLSWGLLVDRLLARFEPDATARRHYASFCEDFPDLIDDYESGSLRREFLDEMHRIKGGREPNVESPK
jgi:hypothetical protein